MLWLFLVLTALLTVSLYILLWRSKRAKQKKNVDGGNYWGLEAIPTVRPLFPIKFIGNVPLLWPLSKILDTALGWTNGPLYGDTIKFYGANQTFVLMNSPKLVQTLLKSTDPGHLKKSSLLYGTMKPFVRNGLLVSTGSFWQKQRKILMKTQGLQSLKSYSRMLNKHSKWFVGELEKLFEDGEIHEINTLINTVLIKVISEVINGVATGITDKEFSEYHRNFELWNRCLARRISNPWLLWQPLWRLDPMSKKLDKAIDEMFDFAKRRIKEKRNANVKNNENAEKTEMYTFRSMLDEMIDAGVEEDQIVDEVNTMMFGGHETTASTLHQFFFCMALHPEIQQECQKEIDQTFDDIRNNANGSGELTFEAAQGGMKYLERCLLETLRFFPPAFIFFRELESPLKIKCQQGKRVELPVGTTAVVFPYGLHRKAEYFPEPLKFDPNRFLAEEVAKRHPYSYVPFSAGPKCCFGIKFAMLEMKIIAANILYHFVITTSDTPTSVPLLPHITLSPTRDYNFDFRKRKVDN